MRVSHIVTINLVPLHSPSFGAMFLNNIIGQPTFNSNLKVGSPKVYNLPRKIFNAVVLMSLTSSLRADKIVRSVKNVGVDVSIIFNCG
ncbi:hypothetical protein ACSBR1_032948 [Camellia fascicularis]